MLSVLYACSMYMNYMYVWYGYYPGKLQLSHDAVASAKAPAAPRPEANRKLSQDYWVASFQNLGVRDPRVCLNMKILFSSPYI